MQALRSRVSTLKEMAAKASSFFDSSLPTIDAEAGKKVLDADGKTKLALLRDGFAAKWGDAEQIMEALPQPTPRETDLRGLGVRSAQALPCASRTGMAHARWQAVAAPRRSGRSGSTRVGLNSQFSDRSSRSAGSGSEGFCL